jgi:WD40 repeat protein
MGRSREQIDYLIVFSVTFSPDGQKVATASGDNTARIWDVASGVELQKLVHDDSVNDIAFSPDGSKVATASSDGIVRIWNVL